jgi:hypothetical protein
MPSTEALPSRPSSMMAKSCMLLGLGFMDGKKQGEQKFAVADKHALTYLFGFV